jgi:MerR family redox-sensitive transcriptional activator SoxR
MDETLTIGQLAARFGVRTSAIRYYEANGVLPQPARVAGQRTDCSCTSLDVRALFEPAATFSFEPLRITRVGAPARV